MIVTMEKSGSLIEPERCTELPEEGQSGTVSMEDLYELQESNSQLRLLVCELLMKNQQLCFQRTDEQIALRGREL